MKTKDKIIGGGLLALLLAWKSGLLGKLLDSLNPLKDIHLLPAGEIPLPLPSSWAFMLPFTIAAGKVVTTASDGKFWYFTLTGSSHDINIPCVVGDFPRLLQGRQLGVTTGRAERYADGSQVFEYTASVANNAKLLGVILPAGMSLQQWLGNPQRSCDNVTAGELLTFKIEK